MTERKQAYVAPTFEQVGSFETLTKGGVNGHAFDGNFTQGQDVPMSPEGQPLIFS